MATLQLLCFVLPSFLTPTPQKSENVRNIWMVPWLKTGFVVYTRLVLTWGFQVAIIECSSTKDVFLVDLFLGIKFKFIAKSCEDDGTQLKRIKFQNSLFSFSVKWDTEFRLTIFKISLISS